MSLPSLFTAFSVFLHSPQFRDLARHAEAGNAFVRRRKLPRPALASVMLSGMRKCVQTELDEFFARLKEQAQLVHHVSEQAFAKVRAKLSATAIPALNDWLVARADADGFVPRWRGRRLFAADASTLCFGHRASQVARAASAGQIAFDHLPGAEMMLAASLHSVHEGERQMLFQHLVRHVASTGKVRVLMTNLLDPAAFPCSDFGDLYHQRWRIEEAFKRLKHRLNLEHVSGLPRQAAMHDFAAKIVCDNLQSLATETALREASLPPTPRINRAATHSILKPLLPVLLLGADIATRLRYALQLIAGRIYSHRPGITKSKPRVACPKPHKSASQKPC